MSRGGGRQPDDVFDRAIRSFEGDEESIALPFIASSTFQGAKSGYYFGKSSQGVGYYRDTKQAAPSGDTETAAQDNNEAGPSKPTQQQQPARRKAAAELLQEAEDQFGSDALQQVQIVDAKGLKRLVTNLERKYNHNLEQRAKYPNDPQRYLDSEIDLDEALKSMSAMASSPELYPELVTLGGVPVMLGLLSHENGDIVADTIELLSELTDADAIEDSEAEARALVTALFQGGLMDLLVQRLSSLNEANDDEASAVYNALSVVENAIEVEPKATEAAARKSGLPEWLLKRLRDTTKRGVDGNGQYVSEILSVLLQAGEEARKRFGELDGVDVVLQAVAPFRKREPSTTEEEEFVENLFNALCLSLMTKQGKDAFVDAEGVELMLFMLKGGRSVRLPALKCLDFATTSCAAAADRYIEKGGLKTLFAAFMGRRKAGKRNDDSTAKEEEERCVSIVSNLLRSATSAPLRDRVAAKFVENEFEKCDRLMEIFTKYIERVAAAEDRIIQEAAGSENLHDDDILLERMDAGLFTLQQTSLIAGYLWSLGDVGLRKRILMHLHQTGRTLGTLRSVVVEFKNSLGSDGDEETQREGRDEKERVVGVLVSMGYKEEEPVAEKEEEEEKEGGDDEKEQQDKKRPREDDGDGEGQQQQQQDDKSDGKRQKQ